MKTHDNWRPLDTTREQEPSSHRNPGEEFLYYRAVAAGAIDAVQDNCSRRAFENMEGVGRLSDDPVTNLRYHFVVTAAMLARFCTESGMAMEEAFGLSDTYIQKMDRCANIAEIVLLHDQMALDYTGRMRTVWKFAAASKQVSAAIDYIYSHIQERITVNDLASAISVSPTYLSHVFKQETGVSVSEYVRLRKIELAKSWLRFSDYGQAEIANMLSYSSQSHFIQQFRSQVGMTPKTYRSRNYMKNWNIDKDKPTADES